MSRILKLFKLYSWIFVICFLIMVCFESIEVIALTAAILEAIVLIPAFFITSFGTDFIHRNDAEYQKYRRDGGQPFWDNL